MHFTFVNHAFQKQVHNNIQKLIYMQKSTV